jgi:hypothetical protein
MPLAGAIHPIMAVLDPAIQWLRYSQVSLPIAAS